LAGPPVAGRGHALHRAVDERKGRSAAGRRGSAFEVWMRRRRVSGIRAPASSTSTPLARWPSPRGNARNRVAGRRGRPNPTSREHPRRPSSTPVRVRRPCRRTVALRGYAEETPRSLVAGRETGPDQNLISRAGIRGPEKGLALNPDAAAPDVYLYRRTAARVADAGSPALSPIG